MHISIPSGRGEQIIGGIRFVDGVAEATVGPNLRGYFEAVGAHITDDAPPADYPTEDSTKAEMLAYAQEHSIHVPKGTKAEILEAIRAVPLPE